MRRPSPALVVAVVALIVACAGSATAASLITGRSIKNGSVTSADIRDHSLRGRDLRRNTITGLNVARKGLDGSDIDESTLDPVPNAVHAGTADSATTAGTANALKGAHLARLSYAQTAGAAQSTLLDEGGLQLQASCSSTGALVARAVPTADGGVLRLSVLHPDNPTDVTYVTDNDFRSPDTVNLAAGGAANAQGTLTYWAPSGDVTTVEFLTQDVVAATRGFQCLLAGTAVHTAP